MSDSWICFIEMTVSIIFTIFDYTWQWQHIGIKDIEQGGPKATNVEKKKCKLAPNAPNYSRACISPHLLSWRSLVCVCERVNCWHLTCVRLLHVFLHPVNSLSEQMATLSATLMSFIIKNTRITNSTFFFSIIHLPFQMSSVNLD